MSKKIEGIITIVVTEIEENKVSVSMNAQGFFDQQYIIRILNGCINDIKLEPIKN